MQVLVIGGTGFVGGYLCRDLVNCGKEVVAVHATELSKNEAIEGVCYQKIDLNNDFLSLKNILDDIEVVVIAVQPSSVRMGNIMMALESANGLKKIVYLSTLLVYPDSSQIHDEEVVPEPKTDYEKAKYEEEKLLKEFVDRNDIKLCIARLANVYGDVKNKGILNYILLALISNQQFIINGDGGQVRDYIFVGDVSRLLNAIVEFDQKEKIEVFNLCTGEGVSILDLIGLVEKVTYKKLNYRFGQSVFEKFSVIGDGSKLKNIIGQDLEYDLDLGIKKMYQKYLIFYK